MNILEVFEKYPTQKDCIDYLEKVRWDGVPKCPYCASGNTARNEHRHRCYTCKTGFSVTVGPSFTIPTFPFKSGSWPSA